MFNDRLGDDEVSQLTMKYPKAELLEKLKTNRAKHKEEYEKAVISHREQMVERLKKISEFAIKQADEIAAGGSVDFRTDKLSVSDLNEPVEYLEQYDQAIEMLEFTSQDEIELPQAHFKQLVQDKWEWKRNYAAATMKYLG